jgi:hypothetical protein
MRSRPATILCYLRSSCPTSLTVSFLLLILTQMVAIVLVEDQDHLRKVVAHPSAKAVL